MATGILAALEEVPKASSSAGVNFLKTLRGFRCESRNTTVGITTQECRPNPTSTVLTYSANALISSRRLQDFNMVLASSEATPIGVIAITI
jgi:hypothetical protein